MSTRLFGLIPLLVCGVIGMQKQGNVCPEGLSPEVQKTKEAWFESLKTAESELLGEGAGSKVYKVKYQEDPPLFGALKIVEGPIKDEETFINELCINRLVGGNPNVVKHIDSLIVNSQTDENTPKKLKMFILFELGDKSLFDELKSPTGLIDTQEKVLRVYKDIVSGIEHIHAKYLIHKEINPKNILFFGDQVKIADFATSGLTLEGKKQCQDPETNRFDFDKCNYHGIKIEVEPAYRDIKGAATILYQMLFNKVLNLKSSTETFVLPKGTEFSVVKIFVKSATSIPAERITVAELQAMTDTAIARQEAKILAEPVTLSSRITAKEFSSFKWKEESHFVSLEELRGGFSAQQQDPVKNLKKETIVDKEPTFRPILPEEIAKGILTFQKDTGKQTVTQNDNSRQSLVKKDSFIASNQAKDQTLQQNKENLIEEVKNHLSKVELNTKPKEQKSELKKSASQSLLQKKTIVSPVIVNRAKSQPIVYKNSLSQESQIQKPSFQARDSVVSKNQVGNVEVQAQKNPLLVNPIALSIQSAIQTNIVQKSIVQAQESKSQVTQPHVEKETKIQVQKEKSQVDLKKVTNNHNSQNPKTEQSSNQEAQAMKLPDHVTDKTLALSLEKSLITQPTFENFPEDDIREAEHQTGEVVGVQKVSRMLTNIDPSIESEPEPELLIQSNPEQLTPFENEKAFGSAHSKSVSVNKPSFSYGSVSIALIVMISVVSFSLAFTAFMRRKKTAVQSTEAGLAKYEN